MGTEIEAQDKGGEIAQTERRAPAGSMLTFIADAVQNPNVDVAKLQALLDMQQQVMDRDAKEQFNTALHLAQSEIPHIRKNGVVSLGAGKGSYNFATWPDMDKVLRPVMQKHGFTLSFDMTMKPGDGGGAVVRGTLLHVAGHSKEASVPLALDSGPGRNNLQAMGSTMSYGKRYVAEMLFNIVRDGSDDDGVSGGMVFIDDAQVAELNRLLKETKSDVPRFLQIYEVAEVKNLPAATYTSARNMLLSKQKPKSEPGAKP